MKLSGRAIASFFCLTTVFAVAIAGTGDQASFADGEDFIKGVMGDLQDNAMSDSKNIEKQLPGLKVDKSQQSLFKNPGDLNDKGMKQSSIDGTTESYAYDTVQKTANDTTYTINHETNPMMKNLRNIDNNVTQLISNNYKGCASLPYQDNNSIFTSKSCFSNFLNTTTNFKCTTEYQAVCTNPLAGQPKVFNLSDFKVTHLNALAKGSQLPVKQVGVNEFQFGKYGDNYRSPGKGCNWYEDEISFDAKGKDITKFFISKIRYDDWIEIVVNGEVAVSDTSGSCERKRTSSSPDTDISDKLNQGVNKIKIRHQVSGGGEIAFLFDIESEEPCLAKESFNTVCDANHNPYNSNLIKKECVGGTKTNENNEEVCIKEIAEYKHTGNQWVNDNTCSTLNNSSCKITETICTKKDATGKCIKQEHKYSCPTKSETKSQVICGETLICQDGDCGKGMGREQIDGTQDFKEAMTKLGVAEELADGINQDMLRVFKANGQKCKKKPLGVADCCKDSGWGLDLSLAQCSAEEKEIGIAKADGRSHYVGSYTQKEDALGLVKSTIKTYCVYPSKLARMIAEQGKPQLGKGFGSAKNPDCSGFTIDELNKLDFNAMDLSEFYENVMENQKNNTVAPSVDGAVSKIKDSLNNRFGDN